SPMSCAESVPPFGACGICQLAQHTARAPMMASRKRFSAVDAENRAIKANRSADKAFERSRRALQCSRLLRRAGILRSPRPTTGGRCPASLPALKSNGGGGWAIPGDCHSPVAQIEFVGTKASPHIHRKWGLEQLAVHVLGDGLTIVSH